MRVRIDSLGRPRRPPPQPSSSTDPPPLPPLPPSPPKRPPTPPPEDELSKSDQPRSPKDPEVDSPTTPPVIKRKSSFSLLPNPTARSEDDRQSSDSGSHGEAYNSEDEHTAHPTPPTTLRAREMDFEANLLNRGLRIVEMKADGNCLFRALAYVLWQDAELHMRVRQRIMEYLMQERDYFSQFVAEDFRRYCRRKRREGVYGNHLELQAAAEVFGKGIEVYSYGERTIKVGGCWGGDELVSGGVVRLSFHGGRHYNAVVSLNEEKKVKMSSLENLGVGGRVEEELERAVLALSLVEAAGGGGGGGGSSSASGGGVPSSVLALTHLGYGEDRVWEAYQIAGEGGISGMVRYLVDRGRWDDGAGRNDGAASARGDVI